MNNFSLADFYLIKTDMNILSMLPKMIIIV